MTDEQNRRAQPEPAASADADYPCRSDGRCQYAIDHGAEGMGHCPRGKCAMADAAPSVAPEPLFLLHSGQIDSGGEQDDWETEADSQVRVDEFCRLHPGKTIPLFAHPPRAPLTRTEALEVWAACADAGSIASTNAAVAIVRETERRHGISAAAIGAAK